MLKRVRAVFQETGAQNPWIQLHMTHYNLINAMGFADVLYDGEDMFKTPTKNSRDFFNSWTLEMLTAIDSPHTWGVPTRFLQNIRGPRGAWDKLYKPGYHLAASRAEVGSLLLVDCYSDLFNEKGESLGSVLDDLVKWGRHGGRLWLHWTLAGFFPDRRSGH